MIYTLTLNTAIDMNIRCNSILPNIVNRTEHTEYSPNGKAVNVSIVLKHFDIPTSAIGYFGGFSGKYIYDGILEKDIPVIPCWIDDISRINVFINDGEHEYKLVGKGPFISENKIGEMLDIIRSLKNDSCLVISGSLPKNLTADIYDDILSICNKKNIKVVLDISDKKLKQLLEYKPFLIKPNDDELLEIFNFTVDTTDKVIKSMQNLHALGAQNVLLTLGANGLYFSNQENIYYCNTIKIKLISSACAGDATLGAFLSEWALNNKNIDIAMKKASATGANVAESDGLGPLDKIFNYMKQLKVEKIF